MVGQTLGHYRIESELGRGGMGVIYSARDERLRRDVAIKLLSDTKLGDQRARALAEARAAAALNHPNICTIYEVAEDGPHAFIVMERVTGRTLRDIIAEGPGDPRFIARIA